MKKYFLFALSVLLLSVGCKTQRPITSPRSATLSDAAKVLQRHYQNILSCEFISGKATTDVLPFSFQFRIQKNQAIWLSAPLGMAKIFITDNKIQYYNKLDQTHLIEDFSNIPLDFNTLQSILLGVIPDRFSANSHFSFNENYYIFQTQEKNLLITFKVDLNDFLMKQFSVIDTERQKSIAGEITYQKIGEQWFPQQLLIHHHLNEKEGNITLTLKNVNCPDHLHFPFEIPKNSHPISWQKTL